MPPDAAWFSFSARAALPARRPSSRSRRRARARARTPARLCPIACLLRRAGWAGRVRCHKWPAQPALQDSRMPRCGCNPRPGRLPCRAPTSVAYLRYPGLDLGACTMQRRILTTAVLLAAAWLFAPDKAGAQDKSADSLGKVYGEWLIRVKPDKGAEYNQLIERRGLPLFRAAGGRMVGWW